MCGDNADRYGNASRTLPKRKTITFDILNEIQDEIMKEADVTNLIILNYQKLE
jgi:hypothetical protein